MNESLNITVGFEADARLIPLRGFSGCRVVLVEGKDNIYVRKTAKDLAYNARLAAQAEKQKSFTGNDFFEAVRVRHSGTAPSGLAYIDMDYISGMTAAEKLEILPLSEIRYWSSTLMNFSKAESDGFLPASLFTDKISNLRRVIKENDFLSEPVARALDVLSKRKWGRIPKSPCHGDLTLENIIVHRDRFYLIDFLDGFADSWHVDMAKLMQDLIGGWSFRHNVLDRNLVLRLASLRHSLEAALEEKEQGCTRPIHDLYALNLLRILPYVSSPDDRVFVEDRLAAALSSFLKDPL